MVHGYAQEDAKIKYNLQFGIAPSCKEQLIDDVKRMPFYLQVRWEHQYDGYVWYWLESGHKVLNRYYGSLFLEHCTSDDLVDHFKQFVVDN